jgi:hypothetical protein
VAYRRNFHSIGSATVSAHQQACTAPQVVASYRKIRIPDNSAVFRIQKTRQFRETCIGIRHALRDAANAWIKVTGK